MIRKTIRWVSAVITAVLLIGTGSAFADSTVQAAKSDMSIISDRTPVQMTAYLTGGNNYVRLRDIASAVDFGVSYDAPTRTAYLESTQSYSGEPVIPASDMPKSVAANLSDTPIIVDGELVQMTAYLIGGNNYIKLRDIARAINFNVWYESGTVYIDSGSPYVEELTPIIQATGSGRFSSTPIQERWLNQGDVSKEDYSQNANPAIFDDTYTRGIYNAIYQTLQDKDRIIPGNNENHFNVYYDYAQVVGGYRSQMNAVLGRLSGFYTYETCGDPAAKEIYKYEDYNLCKVYFNLMHDEDARLTEDIVAEAAMLATDREKVTLFNDYLCEIMEYSKTNVSRGSNFDATKDKPYYGVCGDYAWAFKFLCERASIPCISVRGSNHIWNAVYIENQWLYLDVSANDVAGRNWILLDKTYPHKAEDDPREAKFAMESIVPGSTIK